MSRPSCLSSQFLLFLYHKYLDSDPGVLSELGALESRSRSLGACAFGRHVCSGFSLSPHLPIFPAPCLPDSPDFSVSPSSCLPWLFCLPTFLPSMTSCLPIFLPSVISCHPWIPVSPSFCLLWFPVSPDFLAPTDLQLLSDVHFRCDSLQVLFLLLHHGNCSCFRLPELSVPTSTYFIYLFWQDFTQPKLGLTIRVKLLT